jgi:predicted ATPase
MAHHLSTDVLRGMIGAPAGSSAQETQAALRKTVEGLLGESSDQVYPYLAHLLGLDLEEEMLTKVKYLEGPTLQARYVAAFRSMLMALAQDQPTVLVCEDVHWSDPSSVELGMQLTPIVVEVPLVIVLVARPDKDAPGWHLVERARDIAGAGAMELHLAPLTDTDSQELVSNLLAVEALPEAVRNRILAKAEGNPFFVEEVIRMLIDRGDLVQEGERWTVQGEIESIDLPDTLQGVLTARIDRLPEEAKRALQVAAVIGRSFQVRVLEEVLKETKR